MILVTGSNIFGQWFSNNNLFTSFQEIDFSALSVLKESPKLIHINWSYSLLKAGASFFFCGFWKGKEKQCAEITKPQQNCVSKVPSKFILVGNDKYLILCNVNSMKLWHISLEDERLLRELSCNVEIPMEEQNSKKIKYDDTIISIAVTNNSCLYLTNSGKVYCGLLPSYLDTSHCDGKICNVQSGFEHFMLLTEAGKVYTWGNGRRLQLGHGNLDNLDSPTEVAALGGIKIVKISAGGWHCLAVSEHGDLYAWGWNDMGQLGIRENSQDKLEALQSCGAPMVVDIFDDCEKEVNLNVLDIACGTRHSAILLEDNTVWTTGNNKYGQLGYSPKTNPVVRYFKKCFTCEGKFNVKCGPWCTVLEKYKET